jgi:antitoxin CptB
MQTNTRRMAWRCRRGLLELDIVLGNFIGRCFETMTTEQLETLEKLLDYPDNELWDLITGRTQTQDARAQALLQSIRSVQGTKHV